MSVTALPVPPRRRLVVVALVTASTASIMSTDLYTPSMPDLPAVLGTTPEAVQLTVGLNVLAFGLAQLVLGPASDRFGRRPVMLAGLALFTVFSTAAALAQTIEQLLVARVLQGIAASVEAVVGLAILRDVFAESERVRVLAVWGMAIAVTPAAAPILGGYVHVLLGWRANFWLIAAAGLATTVLVWRVLPESTVPERGALAPRRLAARYVALLATPGFVGPALLLGASLGAIFAFITAGPFVLIGQLGVATEHYGYYQAAIIAAFFLGSLLASRAAGRVALERLLGWGLVWGAAGALALPALLASRALGAVTLTAAMAVLAFGLGPIFAVAPSRALDAAPAARAPLGAGGAIGSASALIGTAQMGLGGVAAALVTVLHDGTARPLVLTVAAMLALAAAGWWLGVRRR